MKKKRVFCTSGESFVRNNILYDCINESGKTHAKPIGCAPEGDKDKTIVKAGEMFTTEHFKYQCDEENDALVLKVINCIDSTGTEVEIGSFFTTEDENGNHQTTECLGDYFKAKKTVLQWTKCTLPSGIKVTEGNFHVVPLSSKNSSTNKPPLQKGEIVSCIRNGKEVGLKCTGCVSEYTSVHVGISGYVEIKGQWTQCRRTKDGCRLINVTRNCNYFVFNKK
uniref:Abnormal cell migration protein 18-like fibronectin type I domain-containing protein n=1 Tax=Panagrolaimus davidi TaxID=227884 RepID=A0A914PFZ3_9BILA